MTRWEQAEALWEELGGMCICQRADVGHWCEGCQHKIAIIDATLARTLTAAPAPPCCDGTFGHGTSSFTRQGDGVECCDFCHQPIAAQPAPSPPALVALVERLRAVNDARQSALMVNAGWASDVNLALDGAILDLLAWTPAAPSPSQAGDTLRRCGRCGSADLVFDGRGDKCVQCEAYNERPAGEQT